MHYQDLLDGELDGEFSETHVMFLMSVYFPIKLTKFNYV